MKDRLLLLAHGAGAPSSSPWMQRWSTRLKRLGHVSSFDYPYMKRGVRSPDPLTKLIAAHLEALDAARRGHRGVTVLVGKSMGGRVGCHAALERPVDALVCLGYPLKGAGKAGKIRDEVLRALHTPVLFVQGSRDSLCPLDVLDEVRKTMTAPSELFVVESGNHSLEATQSHLKGQGLTQDMLEEDIVGAIERFLITHDL